MKYQIQFSQGKIAGNFLFTSVLEHDTGAHLSPVLRTGQLVIVYKNIVLKNEFICNSSTKYASWKKCCHSFVKKKNNIPSTLLCE
jgi:hypothetical protein